MMTEHVRSRRTQHVNGVILHVLVLVALWDVQMSQGFTLTQRKSDQSPLREHTPMSHETFR